MHLIPILLFPFFAQAAQSPLQSSLSKSKAVEPLPKNNLVLSFDDISTPSNGISLVPAPYPDASNALTFQFSGFSLFQPHHPALSHLISPDDLNCAVSSPHAILGSRYTLSDIPIASAEDGTLDKAVGDDNSEIEGTRIASFSILPSSNQTFTLLSLSIKPLTFPSGAETIVSLRGHHLSSLDSSESKPTLDYSISFPAGYHIPLMLEMLKATPETPWSNLWKVEIWADYGRNDDEGYDGLDWEFCVDDIIVGY